MRTNGAGTMDEEGEMTGVQRLDESEFLLQDGTSERLVIQRVLRGSVAVSGQTVASIGQGLVVLVGLSRTDHEADLDVMARKLLALRLFDDEKGEMWSRSLTQAKGQLLLVSQFTLYCVPKGNKPDFHNALSTEPAAELFASFVRKVKALYAGGVVQTGVFGAMMEVGITNDGPTTIQLSTDDMDLSKEREKLDKAHAKYGKPGAGKHQNHAQTIRDAAAVAAENGASPSPSPSLSPATPFSPQSSSSDSTAAAQPSTADAAQRDASASPDVKPAAAVSASEFTSNGTAATPAASSSSSHRPKKNAASSGSAATAASASSTVPAAAASPPATASAFVPAPSSFSALVGNTSLIRLNRMSALTGCEIFGKAEYENPGGSIKDRAAVAILDAAEARGDLVRGEPGWIVEGTAGNTGIGLALAGASRGYRTLVVLADNNSEEKKSALRAIGATLLEVPMVPFKNPNNYVHVAARVHAALRAQLEQATPKVRCILADQWSNEANRAAHFRGTGPEIWRQTQGKVDAFCCGVGTGGTLSGVSLFLKSKKASVRSVLIDPEGSALKDFFESGELCSSGSSIAEGIGQGRLTENLTRGDFRPDSCVRVLDRDALPLSYDLLEHEGVSIGSSSIINVAGAYQLAKQLGPGHVIVTVLCDSGTRYASKLANRSWLESKSLPVPHWLDPSDPDTAARQRMAHDLLQGALLPSDEQPVEAKSQDQRPPEAKAQTPT